ncbi:RNA polymerase II large subunit [Tanacetum coccineum]
MYNSFSNVPFWYVNFFECNGAPAHVISEFSQLLQFHIAAYFDNELPGQPRATQRSGRPIKSICSRLKAKEGRIRGNLMGKRVDFSARTVITPDPTINIDELGVPWSIALNLTYPETVTPYNKERLEELVANGPHPPPGKGSKNYLSGLTGQRLDIRYFKGAEILELMMVPKCIVSPQANRPVMGIVQDTLLGCRKITKRDTFIEKDVLLGTYYVVGGLDGKVQNYLLKPRLLWTGKQVFSLIIPKQINLIRTAAWHSESETGYLTPGDTQVRIEKGEVITGTLCKRTLGASTGSLIHVIWEEVGPDAASKFLGHTQWLVNYWLLQQGFSIEAVGKIMEDIMVKYDGTVRNSLGDVIQFLYGEDGMDAVWIESQKLDSLKVKKGEFDRIFKHEIDEENWNPSYMSTKHVDDIKTIREICNVFKVLKHNKIEMIEISLEQDCLKVDLRQTSDMHPLEIVGAVDKLQERLRVVHGDDLLSIEGFRNSTLVIGEIESDGSYSPPCLQQGDNDCCVRSTVDCVSQTPNTIITFHTLGLDISKTKDQAKNVQCALEYTTLRSVTQATEVWYDPDPMNTIIEEDVDFDKISPWLLRIELNREMMVDKKLSMADIAEKINLEFGDDLTCIFNDDNAEKLILRIRIMNDEMQGDAAEDDGKLNKFERERMGSSRSQMVCSIMNGVNLLAVMGHEDVDALRTTSNHVIEVLEVLGIEAARRALLDELRAVISFDGSYVNYRLWLYYVDNYDTHRVDILLDAAVFAETDYLCGVTENIMLGQLAPLGTGDCDLLLNEKMLEQALDVQLPSYMEYGPDIGMIPGHLPVTPFHNGSMSPASHLFSPHIQFSPGGIDAQFSPHVGRMGFYRTPSHDQWSPSSPYPQRSLSTPWYSPSSSLFINIDPHVCPVIVTRLSSLYSSRLEYFKPNHRHHISLGVAVRLTPVSTSYSPASPSYSPASPWYRPTPPSYSPTSPWYSPTSPSYSPSSPGLTSDGYSPTSPYYRYPFESLPLQFYKNLMNYIKVKWWQKWL